ncbi:MAG: MFS transporter [Nanoarchaeota archaeon]|nr:MFS transporter [Nanoarchaeota archaeon]
MVKKEKVVSVNNPIVQKKINNSLELSIKEGSAASSAIGFGESYISPFAIALNATAAQMGILYAVIGLLPSLVQLKSTTLIEKFPRKKIAITTALWRALLWIPIILTGILSYLGVPHMVWLLILLVGLNYAFGAMASPVWFSWMGSLVPEERRGDYFSRRNRTKGFFGIITMIAGAMVLDGFKKIGGASGETLGFTLLGFGLIFVFAAIARLSSWRLLHKQYEPRLKIKKKDYFSFKDFLKKGISTPFGRFTLFRGAFSVVIGISTPFWTVYMLRDLGFSYVWYMMITVSAVVFQLIFLPLLGKFSDRFGNVKLMKMCTWLIVTNPLWWIASVLITNDLMVKLYLLIIPSIIAGFAAGGFNLAVNNYVYDAVKSTKRSFGLSYMNLMVGVGAFIGAVTGSLLAWINISFMNPILFIFAISATGRLLVAIFGLRLLHEVRHIHKFSSQYLIKEFQPMVGVVREIHYLEHIVKKVEHHI